MPTKIPDDMNDPEVSYRRGYHQGAWEVFEAIKHLLSPSDRLTLHEWLADDIEPWRQRAQQGLSVRPPDGIPEGECYPPVVRLSRISVRPN